MANKSAISALEHLKDIVDNMPEGSLAKQELAKIIDEGVGKLSDEEIRLVKLGRRPPCAEKDCNDPGCVGCPEYREWRNRVENPQDDAGVAEVAESYQDIKDIDEEIDQCERELRRLKSELKSEKAHFVEEYGKVVYKQLFGEREV